MSLYKEKIRNIFCLNKDDVCFEDFEEYSLFEQYLIVVESVAPEYFAMMDWTTLSCFKNWTPKFIEKYKYLLDWVTMSTQQRFSIEQIRKYSRFMDLKSITNSHATILTPEIAVSLQWMIRTFKKKRRCQQNEVFEYIITHIKEFHPDYYSTLDWKHISKYRYLSEEFIDNHFDMFDVKNICTTQKLSMYLINKYSIKLDHKCLSITQANILDLNYVFENRTKFDMKKIIRNMTVVLPSKSSQSLPVIQEHPENQTDNYPFEMRNKYRIHDDNVLVRRPMQYAI